MARLSTTGYLETYGVPEDDWVPVDLEYVNRLEVAVHALAAFTRNVFGEAAQDGYLSPLLRETWDEVRLPGWPDAELKLARGGRRDFFNG